MDAIVVRLAGPVRGKGRPRFRLATGHTYTDERTRNYEATLRLAAQDAMGARAPLAGPVFLTMRARMPIPASWSAKKQGQALAGEIWPTVKPDSDNIMKLSDALNGICFLDDKQVVSAHITKIYGPQPDLTIRIEEIGA